MTTMIEKLKAALEHVEWTTKYIPYAYEADADNAAKGLRSVIAELEAQPASEPNAEPKQEPGERAGWHD